MEITTRRAEFAKLAQRAKTYSQNARSDSTKRAYRSDWQSFTRWCSRHGVKSLPASAEAVIGFVVDIADHYAVSTISRRLTAISQAHKAAGYDSPASTSKEPLHSVRVGIVRQKGTAQTKKEPLLVEDIREILSALPDKSIGVRDRPLILLGFAGALRRSELVALDVSDLTFNREGLKVALRRSKTDQEGKGRTVGIPYGEHL